MKMIHESQKNMSLLYPKDKAAYAKCIRPINPDTLSNLDLENACRVFGAKNEQYRAAQSVLFEMCSDEGVIAYRQEVFRDVLAHTEAFSEITSRLEALAHLNDRPSTREDITLWRVFDRFKELDAFVSCIEAFVQVLAPLDLKSKGALDLRQMVADIHGSEEFAALQVTIKALYVEVHKVKSLTLGINLDLSLNPEEVTLVSINESKFSEKRWVKETLAMTGSVLTEVLAPFSRIRTLGADRRDPLMYNLGKDIERMLKHTVKDFSDKLKAYSRIQNAFLARLVPEISFFLMGVALYRRMQAAGMPVCIPDIAPMDQRVCRVTDGYNLMLAMNMLNNGEDPKQTMVLNDIVFDDTQRMLLLTGPNRGGKTVYTEMVGMVQVLFQAGIFIPAQTGFISPVDIVFTHFPVEESRTVNLGRLGEETKRLYEIFEASTEHTLILLNESLASTSFTEGLYIAQDIVRAMVYLGARALFNTHMHELALAVDEINNQGLREDSKAVSLVTGMSEGKRSYKVAVGPPLGKSYAQDIARKYGISFEQITKAIDEKAKEGTAQVG